MTLWRCAHCSDVVSAFSDSAGRVDVLAFLRAVNALRRKQDPTLYHGTDADVLTAIGKKLQPSIDYAISRRAMRPLAEELQRQDSDDDGFVSVMQLLAACDVGNVTLLDEDLARICGM